jgi:nitroreductase
MSDEMGIFETMRTLRAIRRYKPDPIPNEVVAQILEAGTLAPSGGNGQPWQFIILRHPNMKRQVGEIADSIARERRGSYPSQPASKLGPPTPLGEAPLLIMVCRRTLDPPIATSMPSLYASIYPAVQNMLLAARAQGVGGVLVTMFKIKEQEFKDLLGIPEDVEPCALLPFGYPKGNFGPVTRMPWREVTFADHWGTAP